MSSLFGAGDPSEQLAAVVDTMRELSLLTDPQQMVRFYSDRVQSMLPVDTRISISRRGLEAPYVRVTRFSGWTEEINPWRQPEKLPLLDGGLFSKLIYAGEPTVIDHLELADDDPAAPFLCDVRSLQAIPQFDRGVSMNMVLAGSRQPQAFRDDALAERVWLANLFGRATQNLVLAEQLDTAYREVDRELKVVADIQRALLPRKMPEIATLRLAASYQTSRQAGGDYYDFFPLADDCWGLLIADVSGHGTPAAVMMAVLHCIAHMLPGAPDSPGDVLRRLNDHLYERYTSDSGHFATAFYAVFDARRRTLRYSCAGHNPPRVRNAQQNSVRALDRIRALPLGIAPGLTYKEATEALNPGDRLVLYTDGIVEAGNGAGEMYGTSRLDFALADCWSDADRTLQAVLDDVAKFTAGTPAADDRTLIIADVL